MKKMKTNYESQSTPWQIQAADFPRQGSGAEKLRFLLRYAILAPSSHNTQPWRFAVRDDEIRVYADKSRWLKVADADQRELHVSLGCALENLLVAAERFGYGHRVSYLPEEGEDDLIAAVTFAPEGKPAPFRPPALFDAIAARRTNHNVYDGRPLPQEELARLQICCVEEDVLLHLTDEAAIKRQVDEMIVQADAEQFADPAWREELGYWMGQGVFGAPWLMSKVAQLAVTYLDMGKGTAKKDSELLMSAPVLAVAFSFVMAWLRLRSGSVWTAMFLHAAHNISVQTIFTPLTADTGPTEYVIDEFGVGLAIAYVAAAFVFWRLRDRLARGLANE